MTWKLNWLWSQRCLENSRTRETGLQFDSADFLRFVTGLQTAGQIGMETFTNPLEDDLAVGPRPPAKRFVLKGIAFDSLFFRS